MNIRLPYGDGSLQGSLEGAGPVHTLDIAEAAALADPVGQLRRDLAPQVDGRFRPGETVAIIVSDSFRQTKVELLLPKLIDSLTAAGVRDSDIRFVYATGTHRGPTEAEQRVILGDGILERFRAQAFTHDPDDADNLVEVGETSRGTVVEINRMVHESDHIITTGAVVLHYFGGCGGGRKSIVPGIASRRTIAQNHARNLHATEQRLDPAVRIGVLDGNPVAEDMLEAAQLTHVDFIVNTVLNRHGEIAGVFTGELDSAHREACDFARSLFAVPLDRKADLVIASAGKAKNFIQCHKALFNAYQAMKPGGRIIFVAEAAEGLGGNKFAHWLSFGTPEAVIAELRRNAEINGQTALSTLEKAPSAIFVSELSEEDVALMGGRKAQSLDSAVALALSELGPDPSVCLMPSAAYSVPVGAA